MREFADPDHVVVETGEPFAIVLSGNGVGGYLWELASAPEAVRLLGDESLPPSEAAPGAAGTKRLVLESSVPGEFTLHFERRRPWEATAEQVREAVVVVRDR